MDGSEFEKVTFAAGAEEATALKEAFASSKNFVVDITDASGAVTAVSQSAFADGADPTVTNADYSAGLPVLTEPTLKISPLFSPRSTGTSSTWNL